MNIVFISPNFPDNYYLFCKELKRLGNHVLGIGDAHWDNLPSSTKEALTQYYYVTNIKNYDEMLRGVGYFTHKFGKIDKIESLNEHWLLTEAKLRDDFNIEGPREHDIAAMQNKLEMKAIFRKAGVKTPTAKKIQNIESARIFTEKYSYPVVIKPDIGAGAVNTFKINNNEELNRYAQFIHHNNSIIEEFIEGQIYSFDGLTNKQGNIVFYSSCKYQKGVMEVVNENSDTYYYITREIIPEIETAGKNIVNQYKLKQRFFHLEFFQKKNKEIVALEANIRPPGGLTPDLFNYAHDIDIYRRWAEVISSQKNFSKFERKYFALYISRKFHYKYVHSHEKILANFSATLMFHKPMQPLFHRAMGEYAYIFRTITEEELHYIIEYVHKKEE